MQSHHSQTLALVADVGGTNTRVALAEDGALLRDTVQKLPNRNFSGLEPLLKTYVEQASVKCRAAAVAIAGPVMNGRGTLTNLDWSMDEATLANVTQAETVSVLNDLQAQGHALRGLSQANRMPAVAATDPQPGNTRLVIGVGTGFNAAVVHDTPGGQFVPPSESGHASMPLRAEDHFRLLKFVEKAHGFTAVEDALSGRGLERIYSWLQSEAGRDSDLAADDIMAATDRDPKAREAVSHFIQILGTVAGNLALIHLPFGGVYLIGGVARAMHPYFEEFDFAKAFRSKGRFEDFMAGFSVDVVNDDFAALDGLTSHLSTLMGIGG